MSPSPGENCSSRKKKKKSVDYVRRCARFRFARRDAPLKKVYGRMSNPRVRKFAGADATFFQVHGSNYVITIISRRVRMCRSRFSPLIPFLSERDSARPTYGNSTLSLSVSGERETYTWKHYKVSYTYIARRIFVLGNVFTRYENLPFLFKTFSLSPIYRVKTGEPKIRGNWCVYDFVASCQLHVRLRDILQTKLSVFLIRRMKASYLDLWHGGKSRASIIVAR